MTQETESPPAAASVALVADANPAFPVGSLHVESLDLEAQGVAHRADGKVVFIEGALPFEQVTASTYRKKTTGSRPR